MPVLSKGLLGKRKDCYLLNSAAGANALARCRIQFLNYREWSRGRWF